MMPISGVWRGKNWQRKQISILINEIDETGVNVGYTLHTAQPHQIKSQFITIILSTRRVFSALACIWFHSKNSWQNGYAQSLHFFLSLSLTKSFHFFSSFKLNASLEHDVLFKMWIFFCTKNWNVIKVCVSVFFLHKINGKKCGSTKSFRFIFYDKYIHVWRQTVLVEEKKHTKPFEEKVSKFRIWTRRLEWAIR